MKGYYAGWRNRLTICLRTQPRVTPIIAADPRFAQALFVRGNPQLLCTTQLAMVGSRHHSAYGTQWGHYFAQELALNGLLSPAVC